jgi:hypothetical protein
MIEKYFYTTLEFLKTFSLTNTLFKIILFNKEERATIKLAIKSKGKRSALWYANNLIAPFLIIYSPYLLYRVSKDFGVINFDKSFFALSITGAITLLGINVMRISLTLINEKIDDSKIPAEIRKFVVEDIESIKSKLRHWITVMTIIGVIFFFVQSAGFLKPDKPETIWYIISIYFICIVSIVLGRLITIIQSNFFDNDNLIRLWLSSIKERYENQYTSLKASAEQGL